MTPPTPDSSLDVRLTRDFVDGMVKLLDLVSEEEADLAGLSHSYAGACGFFGNAAKVFKLRDDADRIANALSRAR